MKLLVIVLSGFLCTDAIASLRDNCRPTEVEQTAETIIKLLTNKDLKEMREDEYHWESSTGHYLYNYQDLVYTINYARELGCYDFHEGHAWEVMMEYVFCKVKNEISCFNDLVQKYMGMSLCKIEFSTESYLKDQYVPIDINECMSEIDKLWEDETKDKFLNDEINWIDSYILVYSLHDAWGLDSYSRLHNYFYKLGISNSDASLSIILDCYKRHLRGIPINFEVEVKLAIINLKTTASPLRKDYPMNSRWVINEGHQVLQPSPESITSELVVFYSHMKKRNSCWVYFSRYGWANITRKELNQWRNHELRTRFLLEKIYNKNLK